MDVAAIVIPHFFAVKIAVRKVDTHLNRQLSTSVGLAVGSDRLQFHGPSLSLRHRLETSARVRRRPFHLEALV